jgi:hypothetical protein
VRVSRDAESSERSEDAAETTGPAPALCCANPSRLAGTNEPIERIGYFEIGRAQYTIACSSRSIFRSIPAFSMANKLRPTLADYVVTALSPMLIMGLIGSLVFFLVEILYAGKYEGRLLWTLFFFTAGIVLVARISIESDATKAMGYGLALAFVCWLALFRFIKYPADSAMSDFAGLINFFLMAVVWWCAHKLTWDCTHIDEKRPGSGKGLLSAAGFEHRPDTLGQVRDDDLIETEKQQSAPLLKRWRRFRERQKKRPHNPGLTVVWFSLAALPIFGLGQSLIPADDSGRRTFSFWLAACYVGCALGLLLTTSFLGLRRYLRQRQVEMPKALTGIWLGIGGVVVLVFVLVGALLPRPYSETPIGALSRPTSNDRGASKNAPNRDSSGKGESDSGSSKSSDDKAEQKKNKADDGEKNDNADNEKRGPKNSSDKQGDNKDAKKNRDDPQQNKDKSEDSKPSPPESAFGNFVKKVLVLLKWLVFIALGLVVLAFLFRNGLKYLANFMPGARRLLARLNDWWERLWERLWRKRSAIERLPAPVVEAKPVRRPFTSFVNPFASGAADSRPLEELIAYSFAALEAWAADRNHARQAHETALEFASRLSNTFPSLEGEAQKLAVLVARLAYANGVLPVNARNVLDRVWDRLTTTMPAPAVTE